MKTRKSLWVSLAFLSLCAMPVQAQGLGGLFKKAKKALTNSSETTTTPQAQTATTGQ